MSTGQAGAVAGFMAVVPVYAREHINVDVRVFEFSPLSISVSVSAFSSTPKTKPVSESIGRCINTSKYIKTIDDDSLKYRPICLRSLTLFT